MESFQFQRLLVNPRTTFLNGHSVVQLRIKRQHVQVHLLAIYRLDSIHHVLNELGVTRPRWMHTHHHLRLFGLLLVSTLSTHLLTIGIDSVTTYLVGSDNGSCQEFEQTRRKTLT